MYETSLGGYSSLCFGGVINATIVAGSPMLPVHPIINHSHYKDIIYKHIPIKETIKTSKPVFIIYDPLENGDVNFIKNMFYLPIPQLIFCL